MLRSFFQVLCLAAVLTAPLAGQAGVTFQDIATDPASGLTYERHPSASEAIAQSLREMEVFTIVDLIGSPDSPRGLPGVVLFDADGDGDLDLYATNGPEAANSLFLNQLHDTGETKFVDAGTAAGVAAFDLDSMGACAGDLDNDGDADLLVLGNAGANRLFENLGGGTFQRLTGNALEGVGFSSTSCALGDVDGDGLLDVFLSNAYDLIERRAIVTEQFDISQPNQLYRNLGGLDFEDISVASGILALHLPPEAPEVAATVTWVSVLVDLDLDGDLDLMQADDHGAPPFSVNGGIDRGFLQLFENDGTGHFTNVTVARGLGASNGDWMGLTVADFDHNGQLDVFGTNVANHSQVALLGGFIPNEQRDSRPFLQGADGVFVDTSPDGHLHNPFGWGTSALDLENDGDVDIVYHGGFDFGVLVLATPGVVLVNDGTGQFHRDTAPLAGSTDHLRRNVRGMAVGDLDGNGFDDIVSIANFDFPEPLALTLLPPLGGEFDADAFILNTFLPLDPTPPRIVQPHVWQGISLPNGSLSVELNQGESGYGSVQLRLIGSVGVVPEGRASRDPFGAVVRVTPRGGVPVLRPLLGGSSMSSQDSPVLTFGLGAAARGQVDILWPGGHRNRYFLGTGEFAVLPEIPCAFDDPEGNLGSYLACVEGALGALINADLIPPSQRGPLTLQAIRAWRSAH
jgi:enediyne biosynthesis protein E4